MWECGNVLMWECANMLMREYINAFNMLTYFIHYHAAW